MYGNYPPDTQRLISSIPSSSFTKSHRFLYVPLGSLSSRIAPLGTSTPTTAPRVSATCPNDQPPVCSRGHNSVFGPRGSSGLATVSIPSIGDGCLIAAIPPALFILSGSGPTMLLWPPPPQILPRDCSEPQDELRLTGYWRRRSRMWM